MASNQAFFGKNEKKDLGLDSGCSQPRTEKGILTIVKKPC